MLPCSGSCFLADQPVENGGNTLDAPLFYSCLLLDFSDLPDVKFVSNARILATNAIYKNTPKFTSIY